MALRPVDYEYIFILEVEKLFFPCNYLFIFIYLIFYYQQELFFTQTICEIMYIMSDDFGGLPYFDRHAHILCMLDQIKLNIRRT